MCHGSAFTEHHRQAADLNTSPLPPGPLQAFEPIILSTYDSKGKHASDECPWNFLACLPLRGAPLSHPAPLLQCIKSALIVTPSPAPVVLSAVVPRCSGLQRAYFLCVPGFYYLSVQLALGLCPQCCVSCQSQLFQDCLPGLGPFCWSYCEVYCRGCR